MANEETERPELEIPEDEIELELEEGLDDPRQEIDWKAVAKRYKKKADKAKAVQPQRPAREDNSEISAKLARLELKTEGYSDESIDFLMKVGGKDSLKDPHVKAAIDSIQEQKRAEAASIYSETSKSDVERKFSPEEISAMSPEELYKILPKARK